MFSIILSLGRSWKLFENLWKHCATQHCSIERGVDIKWGRRNWKERIKQCGKDGKLCCVFRYLFFWWFSFMHDKTWISNSSSAHDEYRKLSRKASHSPTKQSLNKIYVILLSDARARDSRNKTYSLTLIIIAYWPPLKSHNGHTISSPSWLDFLCHHALSTALFELGQIMKFIKWSGKAKSVDSCNPDRESDSPHNWSQNTKFDKLLKLEWMRWGFYWQIRGKRDVIVVCCCGTR